MGPAHHKTKEEEIMQPEIIYYVVVGVLAGIGLFTAVSRVGAFIYLLRKQRRCSYCGRRWF